MDDPSAVLLFNSFSSVLVFSEWGFSVLFCYAKNLEVVMVNNEIKNKPAVTLTFAVKEKV